MPPLDDGLVATGKVPELGSKACDLAGLRTGWMYASGEVIDAIGRIRPPNGITAAGLEAAEAALDDRPHLDRVVPRDRTTSGRGVEDGPRGHGRDPVNKP